MVCSGGLPSSRLRHVDLHGGNKASLSLMWTTVAAFLCLIGVCKGDEINGADKVSAKGPKPVISLAESIKRTRESFKDPYIEDVRAQYWKRTFEEIRNLSLGFPTEPSRSNGTNFLGQWKLFVDDSGLDIDEVSSINASSLFAPPADGSDSSSRAEKSSLSFSSWGREPTRKQRFDGFPTWERMLQEWTEDIQEYLDQIEADSLESDYSFSNFGRPRQKQQPKVTDTLSVQDVNVTSDTTSSSDAFFLNDIKEASTADSSTVAARDVGDASIEPEERVKNRATQLPIPAPAKPGEAVLPHTDIRDKSKRILIVTTAALPWRTGTAVNPLLRAAYMTEGRKEAGGSVILMLPWLERQSDQERVYGADYIFDSPEAQEAYIRSWLKDSANMPQASEDLKVRWYTAWQNPVENSIYSMGDITALIPAEEVDICILEEPGHLNWYRAPGESWTKKFKHVVGILHTNYFQYALDQPAALVRAPGMRLLCSWMCRAHCHRVIKLSGTLDKVAPEKELVENVHGVRGTFLDIGKDLRSKLLSPNVRSDPVFAPDAEPTLYFIGKMLWSKGLGSLMELLKYAEESANITLKVDMYGGGPDKDTADSKARNLGLDLTFHGPLDHAELGFTHKIFFNPSTSEVLCTTSAEALAMGKFVILPSHVSNDFFAQFPNCLTYATRDEFLGNLIYAITHSPEPLSDEYAYALTWKAATERLEAAGCIPVAEAQATKKALESKEAGIEISLPPLVESNEGRKLLSNTLRFTRQRYRQFRSRLSTEISQNRVLPKGLAERLVSELDKRLDLDIDEMLDSPKLHIKLSPAELDKQLLELYDSISASPGGDVLRLIGGGGRIGLQNLYMRRQARKRQQRFGVLPDLMPYYLEEQAGQDGEENERKTASQSVRWALRRNLPQTKRRMKVDGRPSPWQGQRQQKKQPSASSRNDNSATPSMCLSSFSSNNRLLPWTSLSSPTSITKLQRRSLSHKLLI